MKSSMGKNQPLSTASRLQKLRAMSAHELMTRVRYEAYCRVERSRHARGLLAAHDGLRRHLLPHLRAARDWNRALVDARRTNNRRFFPGATNLAFMRRLFSERFRQEQDAARVQAIDALNHRFSFFGETFEYPQAIDWHADPVTRAQWPIAYHRDVPVNGGDVGFGDVKHVWELGRHQFLIDLAKAWALEREPIYSAKTRAIVADWRKANPLGTGVAWSCALEPAFRSWSWLWAYFLTQDDDSSDCASNLEWLAGFHDHGWFLYRHLEYYTSPFNHLAGEACALYALGVLFPEFAEAAKWRAHGREVLESTLTYQFYADGGSVEQSTFYHHATTGFYLLAALLGRMNGEEFSREVWRAIECGIEFSMVLQQPDGTTPRIGGADDGKPIRLEHLALWDFRPYQAAGAVLFGRGDFKAAAGRFFEDAAWLLGPDGAARFDAVESTVPQPVSRRLDASGYIVIRTGWGRNSDYLCFDCGEQAGGLRRDAVPSAAHGHADCLSIVLWRRGQPVLVDAGFYCYNGPKAWQDHFRETAAHNTVRIDGRDQAVHINKMAWSHTYSAVIEATKLQQASPWAVGSHDGYRLLPDGGVVHKRGCWVRENGYVVICDQLSGAGIHDVEITFQFAPGELRCSDEAAHFNGVADLHWFAPAPLRAFVSTGGAEPGGGWIAPSLGIKQAAPRLVLQATARLPLTIVTIVADVSANVLDVHEVELGGAQLLSVRGRTWTDLLQIGGERRPSSPFHTDALVAAWQAVDTWIVADGYVAGTYQHPVERVRRDELMPADQFAGTRP